MSEVILLSIYEGEALGPSVLKRALTQAGITCEIITLPKKLAQQVFGSVNWSKEGKNKVIESVMEEVKKNPHTKDAKFVGISAYDSTNPSRPELMITRAIKTTFPSKITIGGGPAFYSNPRGFYSEGKFDYAIRGDGENSLPALIKSLTGRSQETLEEIPGIILRKKGKILLSQPAKLTNEEIQNTKPIFGQEIKGRVKTFIERGCGKACIFCSVPRKGQPVAIKNELVIESLKELAKNPAVKEVSFVDDQLFFDRERTVKLFRTIIKEGLNKRFSFSGLASVDSLIRKGEVDSKLIRLLKKANFVFLEIGVESLNDNILKEIKSGRYTAAQAVKVLDTLRDNKIYTRSFLIAGGIDTKPIDFVKGYYAALSKETRGLFKKTHPEFTDLVLLLAIKGTPVYERALREGALYTTTGKKAGAIRDRTTSPRKVIPKDPLLRELFVKHLRQRKAHFDSEDLGEIIALSKKLAQTDPSARELTRKLLIIQSTTTGIMTHHTKISGLFAHEAMKKEMTKRGIPLTVENLRTFYEKVRQTKELDKKLSLKGLAMANRYAKRARKIPPLIGVERLRAIQELRRKRGFGMTLPIPNRGRLIKK